jgi:hypothetical protein
VLACAAIQAFAAAGAERELPAFPGAEGFGSTTPGGRGGRVITVTNLNADGPGSLQAACAAEGPRIVVFAVSGVIKGNVTIENGEITIAGQTAPGGGITIDGLFATRYGRRRIQDVVARFLRARPTHATGSGGDAIQFSKCDRFVMDHLTASWASDETIDIYSATHGTVQWCSIEESSTRDHPKGRHNYGLICGPGNHVSIHHNYFVHHARRCPAVRNGPADIRNNVVYNFRDGLSHEGGPSDTGFNLVGNYYKRGPSDKDIFPFCMVGNIHYYLRDNFVDGVGMVQDPWAEADKLYGLQYYAGRGRGLKATAETRVPPVTTHPPEEACELVLARAGCLPRDVVSKQCVEDFRKGTGEWGARIPVNLMTGLKHGAQAKPWPDADGDGMPDAWEKVSGLDASADDHNTLMPSGYTAIEEYCNRMAAWRIAGSPQGQCPADGARDH